MCGSHKVRTARGSDPDLPKCSFRSCPRCRCASCIISMIKVPFKRKCGCADICFEQTKYSLYLLKLKLIMHGSTSHAFFQSFLYVLAYKFLGLMVNQMVQRLIFFPRLPYFPVGGLPKWGNAMNKFISIRICIYTIILLFIKNLIFWSKGFHFCKCPLSPSLQIIF